MDWLILALISAFFFGLRGILYQWSSKHGYERNAMLFGVFSSGAVISIIAAFLLQQAWTLSVLVGIIMGSLSFIANAAMFKGFSVGKASLIAILTGLPPMLVVIIAYILWRETLSIWQFLAFFVILIGIILIRYSNDLTLKNLQGAQWGLLAMLCFSFNDTAGKFSTILGADLFPTMFCMFATGAIWFGISWTLSQSAKKKQALTQPLQRNISVSSNNTVKTPLRTVLWGMVVGLTNTFGMIAILTAFNTGITGLVSAVASLNVLLILLYSRVFLQEKFTPMELTGMMTAFAGIILLRLFQ